MIEWTESARRVLNEYCARSKNVLAGSGVDADEVSEDLKRHVEEEARSAHLSIVAEADVRRILARVGEPGSAAVEPVKPQPARSPEHASSTEKKRPGYVLLLFGVILPLGTLLFELATGISAGLLFDPIPSWFHVLTVAFIPALNFWMWRAGRAGDARWARLFGWLNAGALGICIYYSLLYLMFTPIAAIGVIYFGAGLIPLTPHFAVIATAMIRGAYARRIGRTKIPGGWAVLAGFALLVLLQMPTAMTYYGLAKASSPDAATRTRGVRILRSFGDEELMLRACYGLLSRELDFDVVQSIATGNKTISSEDARASYYRVTGQPFNSVRPPALYTRRGVWTALDEEFTWDDALGGESVAGRVKGLSLLSSRMDAVAEPEASVVYCEWTLEFKNVSGQEREARAQIALPPGAVVSRLTLWINGEEREAAFGGRSQVREAYQQVAVVRRRDPVLVTTCGPDRILMQCFPVAARGGVMKVRLGITAPLILESPSLGRFVWPHFLERNFGIPAELNDVLWFESSAPVQGGPLLNSTNTVPGRPFALRASVADSKFSEGPQTVAASRRSDVLSVWSPADANGRVIQQDIAPVARVAPARLVVVVDGSARMRAHAREVANALSAWPATSEIAVLFAADAPRLLSGAPQPASVQVLKTIGDRLSEAPFTGGQDNLPALEQACALAAAVEHGAVLWIHDSEPVLLSTETGLRQQLERAPAGLEFYELQTGTGPDRIVEKLDGLSAVRRVPRFGSVDSDLTRWLSALTGKTPQYELSRRQVEVSQVSVNGTRSSDHITRLWARDEAARLAAVRDRADAVKLATGHQIVTPLTGAVVLETQQQYSQHDLKPVDSKTVPAVPEPGSGALIVAGVLALLARRFANRT